MSFSEISICIDIRAIADNSFQYRKDYTEIKTLAESIQREGLLQAPVVRLRPEIRKRLRKETSYRKKVESLALLPEPAFELAFGHRRLRALLLLANEDESYFQFKLNVRDLDDAQMREIALIENLQREEVHPYHRATSIAAMVAAANGAVGTIARKLGQSKRWVTEHLRYLELPQEIVDFWLSDILQLAHIKVLVKYPVEVQRQAIEHLVDAETVWDEAQEKREVVGYSCNRTAKDFQSFLQRRAEISLAKARFELLATNLHPQGISCSICPLNTQNQASLFPEIDAAGGICTSPTCFAQKSVAYLQQHLAEMRAQGRQVHLITASYYGKEELAEQYEEEILDREAYATQLTAANGTQLAPHALGLYCDWTQAERFMTEVPILLKGEHKGAIDPSLESWREGYERKLNNRTQRRESRKSKDARIADLLVVQELARLPLPEQMPAYLVELNFALLFRQMDSESLQQLHQFVTHWELANELELPPMESRKAWRYAQWVEALSEAQLRRVLRLVLLLSSATSPHAYGHYLVQAEEGHAVIRQSIEARMEAERTAQWQAQDEKAKQELERYQKRMEQIHDWALDEDSFHHKVICQSNWEELKTYLRISPKYVLKLARTLGIKLKKDASDEAVIQSFQQYQPMLAREYQQWLASQEKPSVSESSEAE